jgi:leucyl aminopeptidase
VTYPTKGPKRVVLIGLGTVTEITRGAIRRAAAIGGRTAAKLKVKTMAFHLAHESRGVPGPVIGQVIVEGVAQGAWSFNDLKATEDRYALSALDLVTAREDRRAVDRGRKVGGAVALGHYLARNLQALPGNVCTPEYLANVATRLAETYGYKVTVCNRAQMEKQRMGALLAVAQGSRQEPRFIVLEYKGGGREAPLCFVGKGVTFDSGGISIKPALHMEEMKYDMSGAAAVLGLFETLGHLKPAVNVVGVIPATDNMPSGTAITPGAIGRSHSGQSIEIGQRVPA